MKLLDEYKRNDIVELYCYTCKCVSPLSVVENDRNGLLLQCGICKIALRIVCDDFIQKENEREIIYTVDTLEDKFKVGQNIFHPIFDDNGIIVGKANGNISVNLYHKGFKKLAMNVFQRKS
jgi:hypothetical protein